MLSIPCSMCTGWCSARHARRSAGKGSLASTGSAASDFESFLEAEIAKSKEADSDPDALPVAEKQAKPQPATPPVTGASPDGDVQKEMARIFGELSVTRDR